MAVGPIMPSVALACCSAGWTRRGAWATARSNAFNGNAGSWPTHLLGDVATHPDRFDAEAGEAHCEKALALAESRGMRPLVAHCHLGLARLYGRTGKREESREYLTTATAMYHEMGMTFWLEKAEAELRGAQS